MRRPVVEAKVCPLAQNKRAIKRSEMLKGTFQKSRRQTNVRGPGLGKWLEEEEEGEEGEEEDEEEGEEEVKLENEYEERG